MSKYACWYSWNGAKTNMQKGQFFSPSNVFEREFPIGWVGIDGDERVTREIEDMKHNEEKPGKDGRKIRNKSVVVQENVATLFDVKRDNNLPFHGIKSIEESTTNVSILLPSEDKKLEVDNDGTTIY